MTAASAGLTLALFAGTTVALQRPPLNEDRHGYGLPRFPLAAICWHPESAPGNDSEPTEGLVMTSESPESRNGRRGLVLD